MGESQPGPPPDQSSHQDQIPYKSIMPALDINMIESLSRELHPPHTDLMAETEVCPWTLFLTMSLTLLKGMMPHVPQMLPFLISDPEMRSRAEETFLSPEFQENIEEYFVNNIKSDVQAPLNRQIIKSSETIMYIVKLMNNFFDYFMGGAGAALADGFGNSLQSSDNTPRSGLAIGGIDVVQVLDFMRTLYLAPWIMQLKCLDTKKTGISQKLFYKRSLIIDCLTNTLLETQI